MSSEIDFKALWNQEGSKDIPDLQQLLKRAANLRRTARIRVILQSVVLSVVIALMLYVGFTYNHIQLTTVIGLVLMLAALVSYLVTSGQLLPMLFKSNIDGSSQEYLTQLIRIKRKHEFLDKVMINVYFGLLASGLFLFMLQSAIILGTVKAVAYYTVIFICLTACYIYSKTQEVKKAIKSLTDTIKKLEAVDEQMREN